MASAGAGSAAVTEAMKAQVADAVASAGLHAKHLKAAQETEVFAEHQTNPITLTRWVLEQSQAEHGARASRAFILNSIATAAKVIANAVQKAGSQGLYAMRGEQNSSGEDQKKLDVLANDVMINTLIGSRKVSVLVTEEIEDAIIVDDLDYARYAVMFDPLDGSSNIECQVSVGTIFGVFHREGDAKRATLEDVFQPGRNMVAAGYVLYSSSVCMVLSMGLGNGVQSFCLDPDFGEFVLMDAHMKIPDEPKQIWSANSGNADAWDEPTKAYVQWTREQKKPYSQRYIGSMVSDVHRTLLYGGIFFYPGSAKSPNGKLRLLYECFPMAFLVEAAGGMASTGRERILDIMPTSLHQRSPIFLGCKRDVEKIEELYKELGGADGAVSQ